MLQELGISAGTAIIFIIALYFIIKCAVKNGIREAFTEITGIETETPSESELRKTLDNFITKNNQKGNDI
ncbi:hypothetical protein I5677_08355 [Mobilitalea sibirica]|uniref:Uncharacterized protein n=1 Tax=Mobilitalea sibirica TaxID=1462919 RepID=A0A8J7GYX8_9FIRM|nr:hypothetical protein [Mobilitalea sibirica]